MKAIKQTIEFTETGTFQSYYRALEWLKENRYSYGSTCIGYPVAIKKGIYNLPQKWKNMSATQRKWVDGIMESNDWREGTIKITLYN